MTDNGANVNVAANNEEKVKLSHTSAYDSIIEVLSHGIKNFHKVNEFFKDKVNKRKFHSYSFCYPTALLNYAKTGPCSEAFKLRADILNEISADTWRLNRDSHFICAHSLLDHLNIEYPFVYQENYCARCSARGSVNRRSLNLWELSRDHSVWKDYGVLQARLDRYFARKIKQCNLCKRNLFYYFVKAEPVLCINIELLYESIYERDGTRLEKIFYSDMVRTSLDKLPLRLTVQGSVYILCGVIERTPDKKDGEHHYVAYCRSPGNKWERRDGFEGEKTELSNASIDSIVLVFYASIGHYDRIERKGLLEPAKSAWNQLTNVDLPDLCVEKILDFLDNKELRILIEGVDGRKSEHDSNCPSEDSEDEKISIFSIPSRSFEYTEQCRRLNNVIIYNLPLANDVSDVDSVKTLFNGIPDVDLDNIQVRRCQKRPGTDESPPAIVTFQTHIEAKNIMMNKNSLPQGIKICRDYTKWQRNRYKKLMAVAEKHNKANPDAQKFVKYIDGIPTLVKKKKNYYRKSCRITNK